MNSNRALNSEVNANKQAPKRADSPPDSILIVDDIPSNIQVLFDFLSGSGYRVAIAKSGESALRRLQASRPDLILLDVMLPKLDGISLCRRLRSHGSQSSILLLTAQDTSSSKVLGLDAGADDYMTKPFNLAELLARIRALQRRESVTLQPVLTWEGLSLDPSTREVAHQGEFI